MDKPRYKRPNGIERTFGRFKDRRRVASRYDRYAKVILSAIALAATVIFWLCVMNLVTQLVEITQKMLPGVCRGLQTLCMLWERVLLFDPWQSF